MSAPRKSIELELPDIQRIVFRGYRFKYVGISFLTVTNPMAFKAALRAYIEMLPPLSVSDDTENGRLCWNVAFTFSGVCKLNREYRFKKWDTAFQDGSLARAGKLNDIDKNAPANWEFGNSNGAIDCVLMVNADDTALVDTQLTTIENQLTGLFPAIARWDINQTTRKSILASWMV